MSSSVRFFCAFVVIFVLSSFVFLRVVRFFVLLCVSVSKFYFLKSTSATNSSDSKSYYFPFHIILQFCLSIKGQITALAVMKYLLSVVFSRPL